MKLRIEYSDERFRLVVPGVDPDQEAVSYCSVSTVEVDGTIYGAYLAGDEPELETLSEDPERTLMDTVEIKAYDFSDWPNLVPVDTEIEDVEFDEDTPESTMEVAPIA
jgi:hypothetical protein